MDKRQKETVELNINGKNAAKELERLTKRANDLRDAMAKAAKEKGIDSRQYKTLQREFNSVQNEMRKMQKSMVEVNQVLSHLDTATPNQLNRVMKELTRQLNSPNIKRGSDEWNKYQEQLKAVKTELGKVNAESKAGKSWLDRFNDGMNNWQTTIAATVGAIAGLYAALIQMRSYSFTKEDSAAKLKAITGLDDKSIDWLKKQAIEMATTVDESGMRIRQSVSEILDAYRLVGSNKPELLQNKEGLQAVTKEAIRLAQASGEELAPTVLSLTTALNQFNEGADQATKYVNALAAGSKFGAADVANEAKVILRAGSAARTAGLSFEQLIGLTETLAESGNKGERAGTQLKTFLLRLETGVDEFKPSVVGLDQALINLRQHASDTAWLKKSFGMVAFNVAKKLSESSERVKYYTEVVTDTSVAEQQAAIMGNTASAAHAQLGNKLKEVGDELYEHLGPVLLSTTSKVVNYGRYIKEAVKFTIDHKEALSLLALQWAALTVVLNAHAIKQALVTFWNDKLIVSFDKLRLAMMKNPWTLLAVAVTSAVAVVYDYIKGLEKVTELEKRNAEIAKEVSEEYAKQTNEVRIMRESLDSENLSREKKLEIIEKLKSIIPGYNADLDDEGRLIRENKKALDEYNSSIEDEIKLEVYRRQLADLFFKKEEAEKELSRKKSRRAELDNKGSRAWLTRMTEGLTDSDLEKQQNKVDQLNEAYTTMLDNINEIINKGNKATKNAVIEAPEDDDPVDPEVKISEALQRLETQYAKEKQLKAKELADKKMSQEKYNQWSFESEQQLFERKKALYKSGSKEWNKLEEDRLNAEIKFYEGQGKAQASAERSAKKELDDQIKAIEAKKRAQIHAARMEMEAATINGANKEVAEMKFQQKNFEIEQEMIKKKMELYDKDSEEYKDLLIQKEESTQSYALRMQSIASGMLNKYITYNKHTFDKDYELAKDLFDRKILLGENYESIVKQIGVKEAEQWVKAYNEDMNNYRSTLSQKRKALDEDLANGKISLEGYNAAMKKLNLESIQQMKDRTQQVLQQISSFISSIGNLMSARYDEEIARIEKRYDTEIKYAEKAGKDTTAIEAAKDAEVNALRKKQAQQQEKIDIAQALLNTAMSISQTLATYGTTPWGLAMSAIAAAMGAVQVATIKEQAQAKIAGYYEGGYTGGKKYRREAGVVHEGEFVANHQAVENPNVRPVLDFIDQAQRRNTVASITSNDLALAAAHQSGYLQGGYTSQTPVINVAPAPVSVTNQQELIDVIRVLNAQLADGIAAEVSVTGRRGIKNQEEKYNKLLNNKTRV